MEKIIESEEIRRFVTIDEFPNGSGSGSGSGDGYGSGSGSGSGDGDGYGSGDGDGYGYGAGYGYGDGYGSGYGSGSGSGYGDGYGDGSGDNKNILAINGQKVYQIDDIPTIIDCVKGNYAKGRILNSDLTLKDCFIAKCDNFFAHGETLKEAENDARGKYENSLSVEDRIKLFNEQFPDKNSKVPAQELFRWHNILTGSCKAGRVHFCEEHNIDYEDGEYTPMFFVELTKNAYGGEVIRKLIESWKK